MGGYALDLNFTNHKVKAVIKKEDFLFYDGALDSLSLVIGAVQQLYVKLYTINLKV